MQEFHKKLTKSNIKSQENSTYIFINFNMQQLSQKYHKTIKEYVWKFLEFFREFLNTKTHEISQFFNKNSKQFVKKISHIFNQDSTYDKITKKNIKKMIKNT